MRSKADRRRGQILIMVTLVIVPLLGMLGLVTDLGYMHYVKMTAQSAAEAAAQAAAIDFHTTMGAATISCTSTGVICASTPTSCSPDPSQNYMKNGCLYGEAHGFPAASLTYQSGAGSVPTTAAGMSSAGYWVTFRATQKVPQLFSAVTGNMTGLVVGRSTAAIVGLTDCIYALDKTMPAAISAGGTASVTSSCGIFDNSGANCALSTNGGGTLSAPEYDVVGTACASGLSPAANQGVAPTSDPLAYLSDPSSAYKPYSCPGGGAYGQSYPNGGGNGSTITLQPGVYCGGIQVQNNTVIFSPGTYILVGGGLSTQDTNSHISGTGVMFYNTYDPSAHQSAYNTYSPISIAANSTVSLKADTAATNPYAGILFFDDRSAPTGNNCGNGNQTCTDTYGGGSSAVYQGIIYNRNNCITMYGNSSVNTQYTMIVADCISLVGTTAFNNNYSSLPNGQSPLQQVMVVE